MTTTTKPTFPVDDEHFSFQDEEELTLLDELDALTHEVDAPFIEDEDEDQLDLDEQQYLSRTVGVGSKPHDAVNNEERQDISDQDDSLIPHEQLIKEATQDKSPIGERAIPQTLAVLLLSGSVVGVFALIWSAIQPGGDPTVTTAAKPTPAAAQTSLADPSGELKSRLAFQDQQGQLQNAPQPAPKSQQASRNVQPRRSDVVVSQPSRPVPVPRDVGAFSPAASQPTRSMVASLQPTAPTALQSPAEVDPFERWNQLASLGQSRFKSDQTVTAAAVGTPNPSPLNSPQTDASGSLASTEPGNSALMASVPMEPIVIGNAVSYDSPSAEMPSVSLARNTLIDSNATPARGSKSSQLYTSEPAMTSTRPRQPTSDISNTAEMHPIERSSQFVPDDNQLPEEAAIAAQANTATPTTTLQNPIPDDTSSLKPEANSAIDKAPSSMSPGAMGILNQTDASQQIASQAEVTIGTKVKAKVVIPMVWSGSNSEQSADNRFAVQLTEPLKSMNNTPALPVGTIIIFQTANVSNRVVAADAVGLVYDDRLGKTQQLSLPAGGLLIRSSNGGPLVAKQEGGKGSSGITGDLAAGVFNSLATVGKTINQPSSSSSSLSTSGGSSQSITTSSSNPELWAAAVEGFFSPFAQKLSQKAETANQSSEEPVVTYLPEKTTVTLIANKPLQIYR
jgi:hypothetical protein